MKKLLCREFPVDATHNVMMLYRNNQYDCYVMSHDESGETPYSFMFGILPKQPDTDNVSLAEAIEMAITNAPNYYFLTDGNN